MNVVSAGTAEWISFLALASWARLEAGPDWVEAMQLVYRSPYMYGESADSDDEERRVLAEQSRMIDDLDASGLYLIAGWRDWYKSMRTGETLPVKAVGQPEPIETRKRARRSV